MTSSSDIEGGIGDIEMPSSPNQSSRGGSVSTTIRSRGMTVNPLLAREAAAQEETEEERNTPEAFDIFKYEEQNRLYYLHALGPWYRVALMTLVVFNIAIAFAYIVFIHSEVNERVTFRKQHCECVSVSASDRPFHCSDALVEYIRPNDGNGWLKCDLDTCSNDPSWEGNKLPTFYGWIAVTLRGAEYIPSVVNFVGYAIVYNYGSLYGGSEHLVNVIRRANGEAAIVPVAYIKFPRDQSRYFPVKGIRVTMPVIWFFFVLFVLVISMSPLFLSFAGVSYAEYLGSGSRCSEYSSTLVADSFLGLALYMACCWWLIDVFEAVRHTMAHPKRSEYRKLFRTYTPTFDIEGNDKGGPVSGQEMRSVGVVIAASYIAVSEAILFLLWNVTLVCSICCGRAITGLREKLTTKFVMDESDEGTQFSKHVAKTYKDKIYDRVAANKKVSWADIREIVVAHSHFTVILYTCYALCYWLVFMPSKTYHSQVVTLYGYAAFVGLYFVFLCKAMLPLFIKADDASEREIMKSEIGTKTAKEVEAEGMTNEGAAVGGAREAS